MRKLTLALCALIVCLSLRSAPAGAEQYPPDYYQLANQWNYELLSPEELDDLLAPIALYPDPLIAQILPAATFIDQVSAAARHVRRYGTGRVDYQPWDLSVRAIAHYPKVLYMMEREFNWTISLGQAFIEQPQDVMDAVQRLRDYAWAQGNLYSTREQEVIYEAGMVRIVPARPQYLYIPVYDPYAVYVERYSPSYPFITFSVGFTIGAWLNRDCDWRERRVYYHGWRGSRWVDRARPHIRDRRGVYITPRASVINVNPRVVQRDTRSYRQQLRTEGIRRREGGRFPSPAVRTERPRPGRIEQPRPGAVTPGTRATEPRPGTVVPRTRATEPRPGTVAPGTRATEPRPETAVPRTRESEPRPGIVEQPRRGTPEQQRPQRMEPLRPRQGIVEQPGTGGVQQRRRGGVEPPPAVAVEPPRQGTLDQPRPGLRQGPAATGEQRRPAREGQGEGRRRELRQINRPPAPQSPAVTAPAPATPQPPARGLQTPSRTIVVPSRPQVTPSPAPTIIRPPAPRVAPTPAPTVIPAPRPSVTPAPAPSAAPPSSGIEPAAPARQGRDSSPDSGRGRPDESSPRANPREGREGR